MKRKKVCLIGRVAIGANLFDGQTIKTKILYEELKEKTNWKIFLVDTYQKNKKIRMLIKTIFNLIRCKDVIISLSSNGLNVYYKILKIFILLRKTRVYHYVIGGSHHIYLKNHPKYIKTNSKFMVNWVESYKLIDEFEKLGIHNAKYMPNFKPVNPINLSDAVFQKNPPFRFVIFSRINKQKGIDVAADAILKINQDYSKPICLLDCYGVVEDDFKNEFENILLKNKYVSYRGKVDPLLSASTLKNYFMLLFPTSWEGEGFAATILDAYLAGIPVIATDWNCNSEVVIEGKTGFLYPSNRFKTIEECIKYSINNYNLINQMKDDCIKRAKEFTPDKYISAIISFISSR